MSTVSTPFMLLESLGISPAFPKIKLPSALCGSTYDPDEVKKYLFKNAREHYQALPELQVEAIKNKLITSGNM
jgi:hypothetical protein